MFFLTVILFSGLSGILCDPYDCYVEEIQKCDINLFPRDFPDTAEQLKTICNNYITFGSCTINAYESCEYGLDFSGALRNGINFLNSTCKEDDPTYKVISSNLECIAPVGRNFRVACDSRTYSEENRKTLERHEKEIFDKYGPQAMLECLTGFDAVSCQSILMEIHCGSEVKEAVERVLVNINSRYQQCSSDILEELQPLYEIYKSVIQAEQASQNASKK